MAETPLYEIVSPVGAEAESLPGGVPSGKFAPAPPLDTFENKKIGLIWTVFTNGNILLECFEELLAKRFPTLSFVKMPPGRDATWGGYPTRTLPDYVREMGIDAAIIAAGC